MANKAGQSLFFALMISLGWTTYLSQPAAAASKQPLRSPGRHSFPSKPPLRAPRTDAPIATGDVVVSDSNSGNAYEFTPSGTLVQALSSGQGQSTGSAFDHAGNFYVTNFGSDTVSKFDPNGNLVGTFGSGYNCDPESILFDSADDAYVGQADCGQQLLEFDSNGNLKNAFSPAVEDRGTDWDALASDQCTILYTSEGGSVLSFNVCTNTQNPDFATGLPGSSAYELQIRPNGQVLVADSQYVVLLSSSGSVLQTYTIPGTAGVLFALNLDPDGTSFWTADQNSGIVAQVDIATGDILNSWSSGVAAGGLTLRPETVPPVGGPVGPAENPADGNPSAPNDCASQGSAGDPCDSASGSFSETSTDLAVPGRGIPLSFSRTYSSVFAADNGPLGYGWTDGYNMSLSVDSSTGDVTIHQENESQVTFSPSGAGGYTAPPRVIATLTHNGDGTFTFVRQARDTFTLSSTGQLLSEHDLNGYTTTLAYDTAGQLITVSDPSGRQLKLAYNGSQISSVTDALGRVVNYGYDGSGNLANVTDVGGGVTSFTYASSHLLLTKTDARGGVTTNTYDSSGRVVSQEDPTGRTTSFAYAGDYTSASGGSTTITDALGHVTVEHYIYGERVSVTKGYGTTAAATTTYTYDPSSLGVTSVTDPNGHITTSTFDASGNLLSTTDPLGRTTSDTYNGFNEVLTTTDPLGVVTTNTYDADGNLLSTSIPLNSTTKQVTTYHYGDTTHPGDLTGVTNPNGKTTSYAYDADGDRVTTTDPLGDRTTSTYNVIGWQLTQVSPKGNVKGAKPSLYTTTYTHNLFGLVTVVKDPLGHTSTSTYDADHNLITAVDAMGNTTRYAYDLDNEQITLTRPDGTTQSTQYNADGTVASQTDGAGHKTTDAYDPLGRVTSTVDPLGHTTATTYDAAGNTLTITDPAGQTTTYTYDAADEQTSISYSDGVTPGVSFTYNADGERLQMVDGTGTWTWSYDALHRLTSVLDPRGALTSYAYDLNGNLTGLTYPGSVKATYTYDADDHMLAVKDWNSKVVKFAYDADSNLTKITSATGTSEVDTFTFDAADRLTNIKDKRGTTTIFAANYTRNNDNLVITDSSLPSTRRDYGYSSLSQVCFAGSSTTGSCASPPSGAAVYSYDGAGDPSRAASEYQAFDAASELCWAAPTLGTSCASPPPNATTFTYSPGGARVTESIPAKSTVSYAYDQANRLTSWAQGSASTAYGYNGDGLRVAKTSGGLTTDFTWNLAGPLPLLLEADSGASTIRYVYGPNGMPIEQLTSTQTVFLHHDQLGSTRLLTSTTGSVVGAFAYDAFGNLTTSTGTTTTSLLYGGQYHDSESGLYYLTARYYDPSTAQFLSVDPALSVTHTPYVYAVDDPTNESDPSGRWIGLDSVVGGVIGAVVGTVAGAASYTVATVVSGQPWSWRAFAGSTIGGLVGGAIAGTCVGTTIILIAQCGAAGGFVGGVVDQAITGQFDPLDLLADTALGAAGGVLGGKIFPTVGRLPKLISNVWDPGINALRWYASDAVGGLADLGKDLFTPMPVC